MGTKKQKRGFFGSSNKQNYVARKQTREDVLQEALRDTWKQFMVDTLCMTLNDKSVMKKNVFGWLRLRIICSAWMDVVDYYSPALSTKGEGDYYRTKMDEHLQRIAKDHDTIEPFEVRYPWLAKITYDKK